MSEENKGLWEEAFKDVKPVSATLSPFQMTCTICFTNPDNQSETLEFESIDALARHIFASKAEIERLKKGIAEIERAAKPAIDLLRSNCLNNNPRD